MGTDQTPYWASFLKEHLRELANKTQIKVSETVEILPAGAELLKSHVSMCLGIQLSLKKLAAQL